MLPGMRAFVGVEASASYLDTQTVTVGSVGTNYGFVASSFGSIADGTSNLYSGAAIDGLFYSEDDAWLELRITGSVANSGWTSMTVDGTPFTRASAAYSTGATTRWRWTTITNPFGLSGDKIVTWA